MTGVQTCALPILAGNAVLLIIMIVGATSLPARAAHVLMKKENIGTAFLESVYVAAILLLSVAYLVNGTYNPFLYFRF